MTLAVAYIIQKDSRSVDDLSKRFGIQAESVTTTEVDRLRMVELKKALSESRHRHAHEVAAQARQIKLLEERINRLQQHRRDSDLKIEPEQEFTLIEPSLPILPMPKRQRLWLANQELVVSELEGQLAIDQVDAEWAGSIEARMNDLINEIPELEGNELIQTSCGSTFCRIEFQHENAITESEFLTAVASRINLTEDFGKFIQYRTAIDNNWDGRISSVFFVSRKEYELPVTLDQE